MTTKMPAGKTRRIDYLRISVTDRCNLRCSYCMPPEGVAHQPHRAILTFEETLRLTKIFVSLGVRRLRLTGGEPLVRSNVVDLIRCLNTIGGIEEICMTTNAVLLARYADDLAQAGIKSVNISLDTLKRERFRAITGGDYFSEVLEGLKAAKDAGLRPVKLNTVVMKGVNDGELFDFVDFAQRRSLILRFIEFSNVTPLWGEKFFLPIEEVKGLCERKFGLKKAEERTGAGPAEYYRLNERLIGFIKTSGENCRGCSRLRLTAAGELKVCLYQPKGTSLRDLLRKRADDRCIRERIKDLIAYKYSIDYRCYQRPELYMSSVGG